MIRWFSAAVAAALLAAPVAAAQEKTPTADGSRGAAASVDPLATQAAIDVMRKGGNAFDAAIAAASVLGVVEPYSCGIGGGGFMVFRDAETGEIRTLDSREKSPAAMVPSSFFIDGKPPTDAQFNVNRYSGLSAGVPGTPYAWSHILRKYGTLKLADALEYGAEVAREGFTVDKTFFEQTAPNAVYFDDIPSTAALYLDPDGTPRDIGTVIKNPDLARTYERMGRLGVTKGFYTGTVADAIVKAATQPPVAATADHTWRPGLLTTRDLNRYRVKERDPVKLTYFGHDIYGMGPPSSGATTIAETLNIMQDFSRRAIAFKGRTGTVYNYLEASRLSYADRNRYIGDPSFVTNPIEGLLSNEYAGTRAALIGPTAPAGTVAPGVPPGAPTVATNASIERVGSTTHLSVADAAGNIVSYTFTIESTGGNGIVVPAHGFLLNNELTDFDINSVTAPNRPDANKRPRSSMAPTIVMKNDRPWLTLGSPGGATIITTVGQTLVNRINLHMTIQDALAAPRASQRNSATTEAESAFVNSTTGQELLSQYGERYRAPAGDEIGALTAIEFKGRNRFRAAAEPTRRGGGSAMVVRPSR